MIRMKLKPFVFARATVKLADLETDAGYPTGVYTYGVPIVRVVAGLIENA